MSFDKNLLVTALIFAPLSNFPLVEQIPNIQNFTELIWFEPILWNFLQ